MTILGWFVLTDASVRVIKNLIRCFVYLFFCLLVVEESPKSPSTVFFCLPVRSSRIDQCRHNLLIDRKFQRWSCRGNFYGTNLFYYLTKKTFFRSFKMFDCSRCQSTEIIGKVTEATLKFFCTFFVVPACHKPVHCPLTSKQHRWWTSATWTIFSSSKFMGIEPRAAGFGSKHANHGAILPPFPTSSGDFV